MITISPVTIYITPLFLNNEYLRVLSLKMSNLRVMSLIYDFTVWVYGVIIIVEGFVPIPESKAVI